MKRLMVAVALLAVAGVLWAQEAPKAEMPEAAAPAAAGEVKEAAPAPAAPAAEGEFCCKIKKEGDAEKLGKCHKKGCKFFPKKTTKCFATADEARKAGCEGFCKICCKDQQ